MESLTPVWECRRPALQSAAPIIGPYQRRTVRRNLRSSLQPPPAPPRATSTSPPLPASPPLQAPPRLFPPSFIAPPRPAPPAVSLPLPHPVNCLFPVHCHPDYESIRAECEQWALSFFDPTSRDSIRHTFLRGLYPLLLASFYPFTITRERLVLLTNFVTWLFMLDDTVDEADGKTAVEVAEAFVAVLKSTGSSSAERATPYKTSDKRIQRFAERFRVEVWEKMCKGMSADLQSRLVGEMMKSMEAMKEIWVLRQRGSNSEGCDEEEMMELRIADGFAWPAVLLVEYALGVELPGTGAREMAVMGKVMYKMTEATAYHIILVNDMFSAGKELANMDAQSMVGCWAANESGSEAATPAELLGKVGAMQQVLAKTWKMIQEQERLCAELLDQIRSLARKGDPGYAQCALYAEALGSAMAGNLFWSCCTWRYNGPHPIPWNTFPSYLTISSEAFRPLSVLYPLN